MLIKMRRVALSGPLRATVNSNHVGKPQSVMAKRPRLSSAELEIAKLVWNAGEVTARDVCEALDPSREIAFSTVQTYLSRLEKKGYVSSRLDGRTKKFKSRAKAQSVIREAVHDFLNKMFDGDAMPLFRQLISEGNPSPEDIEELRELLAELEKADGNK
jgi:BlaI family penicillinase repressor